MSDDIPQMIIDCLKRKSKLTEWESEFIRGLAEMKDKSTLTNRQLHWLETIWEKVT